ncbi:MAG TPA: aldo/keto reductase, partial [Trueperaceae bacterium]|nr:aldo/keto reductase [Trueperaceae bacterium]
MANEMTYRRLGSSGLKLSTVSLGGWTTYGQTVAEQERVTRLIERAVELGVNYFDTADVYANGKCEEVM